MKNDFAQVLMEIRTKNIGYQSTFNFEIDLNDDRISASPRLSSEPKDFTQIADRLPPSFIAFVKNYADGLFIDIGNALTIFPVADNVDGFSANISTETKYWIDKFPSHEFIVIGKSGIDYDLFCFYTGIKFHNGEYPVVWFSPGISGTQRFLLLNSSFAKFLTIQYYLLKATDLEDEYDSYEEAANASSDSQEIEQEDINWQNFHDHLYSNFDPAVPKPNYEYYSAAVSFEELIHQIEEVKENIG